MITRRSVIFHTLLLKRGIRKSHSLMNTGSGRCRGSFFLDRKDYLQDLNQNAMYLKCRFGWERQHLEVGLLYGVASNYIESILRLDSMSYGNVFDIVETSTPPGSTKAPGSLCVRAVVI